jgi:HSP20 family molecular chaperone IbpA
LPICSILWYQIKKNRKKNVEVNVEETKIMVFNKRKRKSEENEWKWEGRKVDRVSESSNFGAAYSTKSPRIGHTSER